MERKKLEIEYLSDTPFYYGQKVYTIASYGVSRKEFNTKCPICDGTGEVTIKEKIFDCPNCCGRSVTGIRKEDKTSICLYDYTVVEWIIDRAVIKGPTTKSSYSKKNTSDSDLPTIDWSGFSKTSNQKYSLTHKDFDKNSLESQALTHKTFLTKSEAQKACVDLHNEQRTKLKVFNKENGTNYEYPFVVGADQ